MSIPDCPGWAFFSEWRALSVKVHIFFILYMGKAVFSYEMYGKYNFTLAFLKKRL